MCGRGIPLLYEFFAMKEGKKIEKEMTAVEVFSTIDNDPISRKAFDQFLKTLGTCLAHLAAAMLPDDGIFLCGNILGANVKHLKEDVSKWDESILLQAFVNNKCLGPYLKTLPLFFTSEKDLGMKGCWHFLQLLGEQFPSHKTKGS